MNTLKASHPFLPIIIAASICVGILIGFSVSRYQFASDEVQVASKKFRSIFQLVEKEYVDSINITNLFEKGIAKTLYELDPHSSYIPPRDLAGRTNLDSEISGIGIKYSYLRDTLFVTEVVKGGPAFKSGLLAGDRIIAVNETGIVAVKDQTIFANLIRGEKDSDVTLHIYRKIAQKELAITVKRNSIPVDAIEVAYMIDKKTGYIKLTRFSENSGNELHKQLVNLKKQGLKQLILDLRDNGGGYYDAAVQLCDEFLPKGRDIVYTQSRGVVKDKKKSQYVGEFEHQKLIILINENTASASEIVSAALQDNDRAVIIGRRSFGKGLVQSPFTLFDGSIVRITTSRYYSPSGRCIQKPYSSYANDIKNRLNSGALTNADSTYRNDSLKFHTLNQRTVYGGGGVYPDVFVPEDTSLNNSTIAKMLVDQLFFEYGVLYLELHKEHFSKMELDTYASKFKVNEEMFQDFLRFCKGYQVKVLSKDLDRLTPVIKRELKIHLAEVIWGANGMHRLINLNDPFILKSLSTFPNSQEILAPSKLN
jgi:carboxyl-terminal processing protease